MTTSELVQFYNERFEEIEAYLELLQAVEEAARSGPPRIANSNYRITASQQKILYSSVYLQLYNLVEATVTRCFDEITAAAASTERWKPEDLNASLWHEWVKMQARTHIDMSPQKRLAAAVSMCNHLIQQLPIKELKLDVGGGGNWDDDAIEKVSLRMGCQLAITDGTRESAKRHVRDELGALKLVKKRRNSLAHGSISFVDCADGVDVGELVTTTEAVGAYLREVIASFISYIDLFDFLRSESRPGLSA